MSEIKEGLDKLATQEPFGKKREKATKHGTIALSPGKIEQDGFVTLSIPKELQKILPPYRRSSNKGG